jgi:hypothetical protein
VTEDEPTYGLVVPFVVCETNGGPYDDAAFVAGCQFGGLDCRMQLGAPEVGPTYVASALVPQLDLAAMHRGYSMTAEPWDEYPDEWTLVTLRRTAEQS